MAKQTKKGVGKLKLIHTYVMAEIGIHEDDIVSLASLEAVDIG